MNKKLKTACEIVERSMEMAAIAFRGDISKIEYVDVPLKKPISV